MAGTAVVIEKGNKLCFASAKDWPGLSRSGPSTQAALERLSAYIPRYAAALKLGGLAWPKALEKPNWEVVMEVQGGQNTDFGVPYMLWPDDDALPSAAEAATWRKILEAGWMAFDAAAASAEGRALRTGPRGGGRDLERMRKHVLEAEQGYMVNLGAKVSPAAKADWALQREEVRSAFEAAMRGETPKTGPRGGVRWPARYFIRRQTWHLLDHAWELEDRILA